MAAQDPEAGPRARCRQPIPTDVQGRARVHALDLAYEDVRDVLEYLSTEDSAGRLASRTTGEWMYVFKPEVGGQIIYVKVMLRETCLVVSFHEDEGADHEEDE
jgi:hypothetical protein